MYKLHLCMRYLTTRYIAWASVVSVMLGVATLIVVNSVMMGFLDKMRERLHGALADVVLESTTPDGFRDPKGVMKRIQQVAGDRIVAMTPTIQVFGMLHYQVQGRGEHRARPVVVVGIDPKDRDKVGSFSEHLQNPINRADPSFQLRDDALALRARNKDPRFAGAPTPPGAIIGYQIATFRNPTTDVDEVVVRPGDEVVLTTVTAGHPKPVDSRFVVTDAFRCDMSEYDGQYVFVPIERLQRLREMGDAVSSILIKLKSEGDAPHVVAALQQVFPRVYFSVETWEDKQGALLQAVKLQAFILNMILFFIVAVAGFGILAIFFMIVMEKTRDVGILKSLGASDRGVMGIFLSYSLVLGLIGCLLGTTFGTLFTWNINPIELALTRWTGWEFFPRDIYYFKEIPTLLDPRWVIGNNLGALLIAVGAALLPARRAARLQPVEALRFS